LYSNIPISHAIQEKIYHHLCSNFIIYTGLNKRYAFIDLGTNTFHLLITDFNKGESEIIFRTKEIVGLGAGGINDNTITAEATERGLATLEKFHKIILKKAVDRTYAFGTSALRNATNSQVFISRVKETTGIDIDIINGDREAELIHLGIGAQSFLKDQPYLIMDIGGGSTEFIVAEGDKVLWKKSFEIGVQRLVSEYLDADPPTKESLDRLHAYMSQFLDPLKEISQFEVKSMVGASGTFTTLLNMFAQDNLQPLADHELVPKDYFKKYYYQIVSLPREQRLAIPGMSAPRVDMIVMGVFLVNYVLGLTGINGFYVSDNGLKEGAMLLASKGKL
jgi:exopolyphosphatase/guanosine-5'-triphosphate,3'-diphosphate pyrophosphatase